MLPPALIQALSKLPPEASDLVHLVILHYEEELKVIRARLAEVEARLCSNSQNSDRPPSSDPPHQKVSGSNRSQGGRKKRPGGQKGHRGHTLQMSASPDHVEIHPVESCSGCGKNLRQVEILGYQVRQVYDLPEICLEVVEHRSERKCCPDCGEQVQGTFPPEAGSSVQYGPNLRSWISYLHNYQMLPYGRIAELISDLSGQRISTGTIRNFQQWAYEALEPFETALQEELQQQEVVCFDETGVRLEGGNTWVHLSTTEQLALFTLAENRGQAGMEEQGVLPKFTGVAIHDFWRSYFAYSCEHAVCNAHLLRELRAVAELHGQDWASEMADLLRQMNRLVDKARCRGDSQLPLNWQRRLYHQYDQILEKGLAQNPIPEKGAKSKPLNLLLRFQQFEFAVLRFFHDFSVPFTNNLAEQALRMLKVKMKVSGCFRSQTAGKYFMRIRSFFLSAQKQGFSAFQAAKAIFYHRINWDKDLRLSLQGAG